ncbi:unnamed protein product [Vicia faba]|uniref:WRKY domain-containing protein n=1 Tax=Vicia faba TaxID=3906 RepID=A0AAV0Z2M6_VICFA|nr:unnamed protein product [Vicia faba]
MANVDWDLFSIVRSCKTSTLTPPSSIFETSPHTPFYFDDFTLSHENNPIPNINTSINETNHYPTVLDFPIFVGQQQITPNDNNQMVFPKPAAYVEITTQHFDFAYNHPSVLHELQRERNQLPIQEPRTRFGIVPNTLSHHSKRKSWKRKNKNTKTLECHLSVEKIKEDPWTWRKYGEKIIKGSSHPRSYYKCSSFNDCPAKKLVEKSKNKDNTYVVTYKGQHNHKEPKCNDRSIIGTSRNNSSKRVLSTAKGVESSSTQSKVLYPENELTKKHLLVSQEDVPSSNVGNLSSSDVMMLQFDEPKSSDAQVFTSESTKSVGSCDDDDYDILIPNMRAMSEDILLDFNHLNGGRLFS